MPMKPAAPDRMGSDQEADGGRCGKKDPDTDKDDGADKGNGFILTCEIGLRPLAYEACNLLHAGIALIGGKHRPGRPDGIDH